METAVAVQNDYLSLSDLSATICAELAAGLTNAAGIKERYELSDGQWDRLKINPVFRAMLKDALIKFKGDIGAPARIKMKSEILLEDALPILDKMIHDKEGSHAIKLDAVKQLTVLAEKAGGGKGGADKGEMTGAGFNVSIHINTGGGSDAAPATVIQIPPEDITSTLPPEE